MAITLKYRKAVGDGINDRDNADVDVDENTGAITTSAANLSVGLKNVLIECYEDGNELNSVIRPVTFEVVETPAPTTTTTTTTTAAPIPELTPSCAYPGSGASVISSARTAFGAATMSLNGSSLSALRVTMEDPNASPFNNNSGAQIKNEFTKRLQRSWDTLDLSSYTNPHLRINVNAIASPPYRGTLYIVTFVGTPNAATNPAAQVSQWTVLGKYDLSGVPNGNSDIDISLSGIGLVANQNIGYIMEADYNDDFGAVSANADISIGATHIYECP